MTRPKPRKRSGPTHDPGYKHLYSHAAMVRDLLTGFIDADWVGKLDLGTLERCGSSYVSDDLRERADDILWRVRFDDAWLYLFLLLEFQSGIDRWMAVRIATYIGLLYQDLINTKQLAADDSLPPVLPIVLYNGEPPWNAELAIEPLYHPVAPPLASFRLAQRYLVLDEIRIAERGNLPERNLSAALFQLEASRTPQQVRKIIGALVLWLASPEQASLRRAFAIWLSRVFLPRRMPSADIPTIHDLHEVNIMLSRTEPWDVQYERIGFARGLAAERNLLARQVRRRFGDDIATRSAALLEPIAEQPLLEELGERLIDSPDPADWLAALQQAAQRAQQVGADPQPDE
jgi:hypothetical protein